MFYASSPCLVRTVRQGTASYPEFCDRVPSFTCGVDAAGFAADCMRCDSTLRNFGFMGEAATRVSQEIRDKAPLMLHDEDRLTVVLGG